MEWWLAIAVLLGGLIIIMASGLPVAFSFMLVNLVAIIIMVGSEAGLRQLILSIESSITTFTLVAVPMFVLMGEILFHSGIAIHVLDALDQWLGPVPGRLSLLTVAAGTLFATLSGSTMANTALLGTTLLPEMQKRGYHKPMILGPIMGAGGLAMIIPPSALAVVLGSLGRIPIAELLIAGFIPGFLMAFAYAAYIVVRCFLQPHQAPRYQAESVPLSARITSFARYVLPMGGIIFMVLGLLFLGVATPSESAALGALGSFTVVAAYRKLNWEVVQKSLTGTVRIVVMLLIIMVSATQFSQLLAYSGATRTLVQIVLGQSLSPIVVVILTQVILLFLGTFMEQVCMMMITLPLYMPIINALGIDPIWFGEMMLINLEVGLLTPPFGLILFVMKGVAPADITMADIIRAAVPFFIIDVGVIALIMLFPILATWLPSLML